LRSISKYHEHHPFEFAGRSVGYEPGEAAVKIKGGNSNWRGPIWFPTSYLLIHSLLRFGQALGDELQVTGDGRSVTSTQLAQEIANRMIAIFTRDASGRRPSSGEHVKMQRDPHWRDLVLFHEYYHGDTGKGLGASHQTGWSGLIANLIDEWRR
jgi:hypothetical protein